jgi:hypothetical protein
MDMNADERRIITDFVTRISGGAPQGNAWGSGSVPQSQARPTLPPVDPEADQMLFQLFQQYPEARYRITQTAFVQEAALVEAQNRIRQLEWEVQNAQRQAQAAPAPSSGGFLGGLFGGGRQQQPMPQQQYAPPPQPQYPPGYNPAMLQQQPASAGPSFMGSALRTAAGVAGGVVVGSALMNMFSGHHGSTANAATGNAGASPWSDPGGAAAQTGWGGPEAGAKDGWGGGADKFSGNPPPAYGNDATQAGWGGQQGGDYNSGGGYGGQTDGGYNSGGGGGYDGGGGGGYDGGGGGGGGSDDQ